MSEQTKPSELTKGEMLRAISTAFSCYRTWRWGDEFGTMEPRKENAEMEIAIRRLVEKQGEWQKKAGMILSVHRTMTEEETDDLLEEIRDSDFRKEGR